MEGEEEGRGHKHGNQSDRRRVVGIKEQQEEERSAGISSLIFLLSRTSQASPLQQTATKTGDVFSSRGGKGNSGAVGVHRVG